MAAISVSASLGAAAASAPQSPKQPLKTGSKMPLLGLGTWKIPKPDAPTLVKQAIEIGWRHLDCACDYGNETEVGQGIKAAVDAGICAREDLWVTSKLWNTYHAKEHVKAACKRSLSDLGLDYLDLYHVHFPISLKYVPFETRYPPEWTYDPKGDNVLVYEPVPVAETWAAMEELVDEGLVKNIGVCNFTVQSLADLLSYARIPPSVLQVEIHPYLTQPYLRQWCSEHDVHVTGFSPLGSVSYVDLGWTTMQEGVINEKVTRDIAATHGVTPAQVLLRWGLQHGMSLIPKTTKVDRMVENLDVFGFELTPAEMSTLDALNCNKRYNDPAEFCKDMGGPCPIYC